MEALDERNKSLIDKLYDKANVKENKKVIDPLRVIVFELFGEDGMNYVDEKLIEAGIFNRTTEQPKPGKQ